MNLNTLTKKKGFYTALAFLLPVIGLLIVRLIRTLAFNGEYSMLYSDCYHQYYPFFLTFRETLRSGGSLLYNWDIGLGLDYLGLASYYLASPLNLLSVLVPDSLTLAYFSALMPIKLGLASLFFSIFLKNAFRKNDLSIALFGCFYALCAWALGYQWNIMWLDTFALLPLVALGTLSLLEKKRFVLYTFSLFLSIFANYYVGLFTCIFTLLVFICYEICRWDGFKKFFADLCRIALFSVLAIGMTAILELPTLAALQTTNSSVNKFPTTFRLNIADKHTWLGLLDAMRQVAGNMNAGISATTKEGLPNIYCGVVANLFAFLFLTSSRVKLRDKLCTVFLLLFFNVSFIIRQLDYIWHGFHFTNQIPYRFSFLYSFVMLYMAYRGWLLRKSFKPWQILTAAGLSLALVMCSNELSAFAELLTGQTVLMAWSDGSNILSNLKAILRALLFPGINLALIAAYAIALIYSQRVKPAPSEASSYKQRRNWLKSQVRQRQSGARLLLVILAAELVLQLVTFGRSFPGTNVSNYPRGKEDSAAVIAHMKELEQNTLFYRAETAHTQIYNDAALNGYSGITTFTSSANVKVTKFMKAFGYGAQEGWNRYAFEESSPVGNLFLGLKYMIERDGSVKSNAYFDEVYSSGDVHLLKNNAYLPLGFLTDPQLINVEFDSTGDPFVFQNELLKAAAGITADAWSPLCDTSLIILGSDLDLQAQEETGYCSYTAGDTDGTITYVYTADREGLLCFHVDQSKRNGFSIYINSSDEALYTEGYALPQMFSVCNVVPGDVVEIEFTCSAGEDGTINLSTAILDEAVFREAYDVLSASTLELTSFENTRVDGTINCDRDGVLYTSIPQNGNWTAIVDGEPAQIALIGGAMVGLILSEGEHTISFRYENKAFTLGLITSLVCLLVFLVICWCVYKPKFPIKKKKSEPTK